MIKDVRRPFVQCALFLAFFASNAWALGFGEIEGSAAPAVFSPVALVVWHYSMMVGALAGVVGQLTQFVQPSVMESVRQFDRYVIGLFVELGGQSLFSLNMVAYTVAIVSGPVSPARAILFGGLSLGFLARTVEIVIEVRKIVRRAAPSSPAKS